MEKKNRYYSEKYLKEGEVLRASTLVFTLPNGKYDDVGLMSGVIKGEHNQGFLALTNKRLIIIWENAFGNDIGKKTERPVELSLDSLRDIRYREETIQNDLIVWELVIETDKGELILGMNDAFKENADKLIAAFKGSVMG